MKQGVAGCILFFWGVVGCMLVITSPSVWLLSDIRIQKKDDIQVLGYRELGQRNGMQYADSKHLAVRFGDRGAELANVSLCKKIEISGSNLTQNFLKRIKLKPDDIIHIGPVATLRVECVDKDCIALSCLKTGQKAKWENGRLTINHKQEIRENNRFDSIKSEWRWRLKGNKEIRAFSLGGSVNLQNKWAIPDTPPFAAWITYQQGQFYLAPGEEQNTWVQVHGNQDISLFSNQWTAVSSSERSVSFCIIGRTHYQIHSDTNFLDLIPVKNKTVFHKLPPSGNFIQMEWIGSGFLSIVEWLSTHKLTIGLSAVSMLIIILLIWDFTSKHPDKRRTPILYGSWLLLSFFYIVFKAGNTIDLSWSLLLCFVAWIWATFALNRSGYLASRGGWIWCCVLILAGFGVVTQLQILAGADNTRWLKFAFKQAFYTGLIGWSLGAIAMFSRTNLEKGVKFLGSDFMYYSRLFVVGKLLFVIVIIGLLVYTAVRGDELGLGVFQLSEVMKAVVVILGAFTAMEISIIRTVPRIGKKHERRRQYVGMAIDIFLTLTLMLTITLISFIMISDFSPALIIGLFSLIWLWLAAEKLTVWRNWVRLIPIIILAILLIFGQDIYRHPDRWESILPQFDRFAVWVAPYLHPHSGAQVISAMAMAGKGGLLGGDSSFGGLNSMGNHLPAVQDDFALSFLLYKFGALPGLILFWVQCVYLYLLWQVGATIDQVQGIYALNQGCLILGFIIKGLVIIHGLQWIIAWGNALGLFPVMGQPMTWLSSGNSHLICLALFLLIAGIAGNRINER